MTPTRARLRVQLILSRTMPEFRLTRSERAEEIRARYADQDGRAACCGRPIPYHRDPDPDFSGPTNYLVTTEGELICGSACP